MRHLRCNIFYVLWLEDDLQLSETLEWYPAKHSSSTGPLMMFVSTPKGGSNAFAKLAGKKIKTVSALDWYEELERSKGDEEMPK